MVSDGSKSNNLSFEESLKIKQDNSFFSMLMSKDTSICNTSSRVLYYGETTVAVPFTWEAQPGTPKHPLCQTYLPPLTPPPSYFSYSNTLNMHRNTKGNIFSCILPMFSGLRKNSHMSSSPSSSSYSSSSMEENDKGKLSFSNSSKTLRSLFKHRAPNGFRGCYASQEVMSAKVNNGGV